MDGETSEDVLTLDADAADTIETVLREEGYDLDSAGLRVAVERGGCAGLSYRFDLTDAPGEGHVVQESGPVTVFVDAASVEYVRGAEVSVGRTAHGTGFTVDNPNAEQQCGCGLSFQ